MENNDDDTIPMQYLNNENPYAFCKDYHKNSINLPEKKIRLSALQRIQPHKVNFRMPHKHLERERNTLIDAAAAAAHTALRKRGLALLGIEYHDTPEELFEQHLHVPEILDIALALRKFRLVHHQRRLRAKVSVALNKKLSEDIEYNMNAKGFLEIDNLKDALIFCKLEDLYGKKE